MNFKPNTLWTADNLPVMRGMNSETVDLIYMDPPFNSNANYAAPTGSKAAGAAFKDTWNLSDIDLEWLYLLEKDQPLLANNIKAAPDDNSKSYLCYIAVRVLEMKRLLKDTGSIYLHCDPTMSHYLKTMMDCIFGRKNFRNELIWHYHTGGAGKSQFSKKHDVIFWFSKTNDYKFNPIKVSRTEKSLLRAQNPRGARISKSNTMKVAPDVWTDIDALNPMSKERTGYPTQKPLALLSRIINASSNEGDLVLDPFCGCVTAPIAAHFLNRNYIGIDISIKAKDLLKLRMEQEIGLFQEDFKPDRNFKNVYRDDVPTRTDLGTIPKYNSKQNKDHLYGTQKGLCNGCKNHYQYKDLEIDHIIAKTNGGIDHIDNLQLLCGNCNRLKGANDMATLKSKLNLLD